MKEFIQNKINIKLAKAEFSSNSTKMIDKYFLLKIISL